ncbi:MAG: DUF559 domain-containing protein [Chitinophagaceae bacterium]
MNHYNPRKQTCSDCNAPVSENVQDYSKTEFGIVLCYTCQQTFKTSQSKSTTEARLLYAALKKRGVPAELEKFDGHKTIDIAVTDAKVNIEVDGGQHNSNPNQALSDLKRTLYSFKKGYLTLRIPNTLIQNHLDKAADYITDFLMTSRDELDFEW